MDAARCGYSNNKSPASNIRVFFLEDQAMPRQFASVVRDSAAERSQESPAAQHSVDETIDSGSSSLAVSAGDVIRDLGHYEILKEIARDGMEVVFKARHQRMNRAVALRMILSGRLAGEADIQRLPRV